MGFFFALHVQGYVVVSQEFVVQRQIDAVRIDVALSKGLMTMFPDAICCRMRFPDKSISGAPLSYRVA